MPIRVVCASLLICFLLGCQLRLPQSAEGACESRGFKRGTSDFDLCVKRKDDEAEAIRAQQYQIQSHGPAGR